MEPDQNPQNISWWIASLAASVVLCAVFAGYLFDIKEDLNNSKIRASVLEQHVNILSSEVDNLRRHILLQQMQVVPADKAAQLPPTTVPIPETSPTPTSVAVPPTPQPIPPAASVPAAPAIAPPSMPMPPSPATPAKH